MRSPLAFAAVSARLRRNGGGSVSGRAMRGAGPAAAAGCFGDGGSSGGGGGSRSGRPHAHVAVVVLPVQPHPPQQQLRGVAGAPAFAPTASQVSTVAPGNAMSGASPATTTVRPASVSPAPAPCSQGPSARSSATAKSHGNRENAGMAGARMIRRTPGR